MSSLSKSKIPTDYILRRFFVFFLTIWLAASIIWAVPRLTPGDPIASMVGQMMETSAYVEGADEIIEGWRARFGLDKPLWVQYLRYMWNCLTLDFGYSYSAFPAQVSDMIAYKLPWTIGLLMLSLVISFGIGNFLGALMIWSQTPALVRLLIPFGMIFTSVPTILAGLFLLYIFAFLLRWFPLRGIYDQDIAAGFNWDFIASVIHHGTLPALSIILVSFGAWALGMRGMMITVQGEDYTLLGRAKGLRPLYLLYRYMIRNAILPQITAFAFQVGTLLSGQILVEIVFGYQGMGMLIYEAILSRDYALLQGASYIIILMTAISVLIVDLAYPFIDPRIRLVKES